MKHGRNKRPLVKSGHAVLQSDKIFKKNVDLKKLLIWFCCNSLVLVFCVKVRAVFCSNKISV